MLLETNVIGPVRRLNLLAGFVVVLGLLFPVVAAGNQAADTNSENPNAVQLSGTTMGPIIYKVTVSPDRKVDAAKLKEDVQAVLDRVNGLMSTYIPDSDVSRFNASDSTDWIEVDPETVEVVDRALEISELTEGAFDITVGPAVNLWNFGPDKKKFSLPTDSEIDNLKKSIGFQSLSVRNSPAAIKKANPDLQIDLSAIAKGYAVDAVAAALDGQGFSDFMVEVGGEVYARGQSPKGKAWRIGVEAPRERVSQIHCVVEIANQAVATSGDYRNFKLHEGKRYSHTIDPVTCRPVKHELAVASIVAPDCMTADALATAVMVMGAEKGKTFCESNGVELLTITRDANSPLDASSFKTEQTTNYPVLNKANVTKPAVGDKEGRAGRSILPVFLAAAGIFALAILGMAVGSIFANKPVQGSCGGLSSMTNENGESACSLCSKPTTDCVERTAESVTSSASN